MNREPRDMLTYRHPRSLHEAFGPYADASPTIAPPKHRRLLAVVDVLCWLASAALIGLIVCALFGALPAGWLS